MRIHAFLALSGLALCACNAPVAAPPPQQTTDVTPVTPSNFQMPQGTGCAGAIARYRAVIANDHAMGHVEDKVYVAIEAETNAADKECSAGHDAQAQAMVRASEAKHGYPTNL